MKKVLVLYYSMYGHIEQMAEAVAAGAASVPGVEVTLKRVPETMPEDVARQAGAKELALARFQGEHVAKLAVRLQ